MTFIDFLKVLKSLNRMQYDFYRVFKSHNLIHHGFYRLCNSMKVIKNPNQIHPLRLFKTLKKSIKVKVYLITTFIDFLKVY